MPNVNPGPASVATSNSIASASAQADASNFNGAAWGVPAGTSIAGISPGLTSSIASQNTTLIQTALTAGGNVSILQPGVFYINATLIYGSNTALTLGANTTIRLAPLSNVPMLMSSALVSFLNGGTDLTTGGTVVTLTQGTGSAVNVAWTNHGLSAGQGIWIAGSTISVYNGVFRVVSIVDANNFTIFTTRYGTSAPAGTIRAIQAVQNFNLSGGTWDMNNTNQSIGVVYQALSIIFAGVIDSTIDNVASNNAFKYLFSIQAATNCRLRNLKGTCANSDFIKFYGPLTAIKAEGMSGISYDDFVSFSPKDFSPYDVYQFKAPGDIYDVTLSHVSPNAENVGIGIHLYPTDNEFMDNIVIEQVTGTALGSPGISINRPAGASIGSIGRLTFRNVQCSAEIGNTPTFNGSNFTCDQLTIDDCTIAPGSMASTGNNWLSFTGGVVIAHFITNRIKSTTFPNYAGNAIFCYINGASISKWTVRECTLRNATGTFYFSQFNSTANVLGDMEIEDCYVDAVVNSFVYFSAVLASGTPNITLRNNSATGITRGIRFGVLVNAHIRLEGNTLAPTGGVIETSVSNTIRVASDGCNDFNSGTLFNVTAGTPVITLYGNDLSYDAGLLATTKGQYFTHASAVAGRNAANQQGPCIGVDGTHFYAIGTGTAGVNTLIV